MQPTADLPDNYYLTNFHHLVSHCLERYADLLPDTAQAQLQAFIALPENAQRLFVRLHCRKHSLFRSDKIQYAEIDNLPAAAQLLAEQQLLQINPPQSLETFCNLLTVPELRKLFSLPAGKRQDLLDLLFQQHSADSNISDVLALLPFDSWQLTDPQLSRLLTLLYFGNLHQEISEFVLRDLGLLRYEQYPLTPEHRLFQSRQQLEHLLAFDQLWQQLDGSDPLPDKDTLSHYLPASGLLPLNSQSRRLNDLGRAYERAKQPELALRCYEHSALPPAQERRARILAESDLTAALALCEAIADNPQDITEQIFSDSFIPRLKRRAGGPPVPRQRQHWPQQQLTLRNSGERVELQVLAHYQAEGWQGLWCENDLLAGLFGLLCWDIIFADIPGAFSHPFQRGPLDLNSARFFNARRALFEQRFRELKNAPLESMLRSGWQQKNGLQNPLVNWKQLSVEQLCIAADRIPRHTLISLLRQLAFDIRHFRSGLPDLFLWREQDYLLIEVKGPGDALQESQKRWLKVFAELQVPHHLCFVTWTSKENEP